MKRARIIIYKAEVDHDIDAGTFKRTDAALDGSSDRQQNAVASDAAEDLDGSLIARYRDRRDARIRERLKYALKKDPNEVMEYRNILKADPAYVYELVVSDSVTADDIESAGTRIHEYIVRGTLYDWYLGAGLQPTDSADSLQALEDAIAASLRGRSWGHRPMQPFGPAFWEYDKP
jgi:hypothetical protein